MQIHGPEATAVARRYLQGQGDVMALAMARLAGLPLGLWAGIRDRDGGDDGGTEILPAHAVVVLDTAMQRWADVNGIQQGVPEGLAFDRPVDRVVLLPATEADVRQAFTVDTIDEEAIAAAIAFARTGAPVAPELDALRRAGAALPPAEAAPPAPLLGPGSPAFARWFRASKIVGPDGAPLRVFHGTKASFDVFESMAPTTVFRLDGEEVLRADSWDVDGDWERLPERFHYGALTDAVTLGPEAALAMREREAARYVADGLDPDTVRRLRDLRRMLGRTLTQLSESRVTGDGFYFTPDLGYSFVRDIGRHDGGNVMPVYLSIQNPVFLNAAQIEGAGAAFNVAKYRAQGYDGAIFADYPEDLTRRGWGGATQIVAFEPTQIKSAIGNRGTYSLDEPDVRFSRTSARRLAPEVPIAPQADTAFARWVAGSRVVDAAGQPIVVYHGSARRDPAFRPDRGGDIGGIYFTPSPAEASEHARMDGEIDSGAPFVVPAYLSIRRPKVFINSLGSQEFTTAQMREWEAQGFDGVIGQGVDGRIVEIAAFRPEQIWSVFDGPQAPALALAAQAAEGVASAPAAIEAEAGAAPRKKDALRDAAFDAWFAGSQVVDDSGAALPTYHGTAADVTAFHGMVTWVSAARDLAHAYASAKAREADGGANIMPLHASIRKPLDLGPLGNHFTLAALREKVGFDFALPAALADLPVAHLHPVYRVANTPEFIDAAIAAGYDGLFGYEGGRKTWGAFSPTALKSAIGNRGTYDAQNPDVRFSRTAARPLASEPAEATVAASRTEAFQRWFVLSRVVDGDGQPRVVYHGSPRPDIVAFDRVFEGQNTGAANAEHGLGGFYFSDSPDVADTYARTFELELANTAEQEFGIAPRADLPVSTTYPVYLSLQRPLEIDGIVSRAILQQAHAGGHDGIIARQGAHTEYVAFRPEQVKSVFNAGEYSLQSADIRFSRKHRFVSIPPSALADLRPISIEHAWSLVAGKTEKPGGVDPVRQFGSGDEPHARLNWFGRVPLTAFVENDAGDLYDDTVNRERALAYAQRSAEDVPPVLAVIGRHSGMLNILDGGHRLSAARLRGDTDIAVILRLPPDLELRFEGPALAAQAELTMTATQPSEPAVGVSADAVLAALEDDLFSHHVDVYGTFAELPDYIRKQARGEGDAAVEGFWDPRRNRVGLVAEFLSSPERARQVARHELVGHYGLETMLGPDGVASVTAMVIAAERAGNAVVRGFGARVDAEQPGLSDPRRALEIVAMMAEDNVHNHGIMRRVADGMRVFLSRIGFLKSDVTDARLCALLRDSQRYVRNLQAAITPPSPTPQPDRVRTYYGSIGAKERDAALLASMGVELGPYDPATGRFPARFGEKANAALQDFPEDFVVSAIPVRNTAEVGHRGLCKQDKAWLMERRAVLDWHLSAANQTVPREALLGAEKQSVESALQALKAAARPATPSPSGDGLAPA